MSVSLVSTVFNDVSGIRKFLDAMRKQTTVPDEIVITDAGSTDGAWEALEEAKREFPIPVKILQEERCNVARGRNLAIEAASGEIIVSTDIGCSWEAGWIERLVQPMLNDSEVELVIGSWAVNADLNGLWSEVEWALKGDQKMIASETSYSSSRTIAYRKVVWKRLGKYPEDLSFAGDDALFHYLIEAAEVKRVGVSDVDCHWHRHGSLQAFIKEQQRYGYGDGEAGLRLKDYVYTGTRIGFELTGIPLALVFMLVFEESVGMISAGLLLALVFASVAIRVIKLLPASRTLSTKDISFPLSRIVYFVYACKIHWLISYTKGWIRGIKHCRSARQRLQQMSPESYQQS